MRLERPAAALLSASVLLLLGATAAQAATPLDRVIADARGDARLTACAYSLDELRDARHETIARRADAPLELRQALRAAITARKTTECAGAAPAAASAARSVNDDGLATPVWVGIGFGAGLLGGPLLLWLGRRRRSATTGGASAPESLAAFGQVFANPDLRRVQLATVGSIIGHWGYSVAFVVWAYDAGGASLVGLAIFLRLIPAAIAAPFAGALADRYPRKLVMVGSELIRASALGGSAIAIALDAPAAVVLTGVAIASTAASAFHPASAALLPSLTRTPEELTAANVTTSAMDGIGQFAGPALGGVLLVATSPEAVFGVTVLCLLWSAVLIVGVHGEESAPADADARPERLLAAVRSGFAAAAREPSVRLIIGLVSAQTFVAGLLSVLVAVMALGLLERGDAWVGYLNAAVGIGGLAGIGAGAWLVGRGGLARAMGIGTVLFGAPLLIVGVWHDPAVALLAMAIIGVGNTLCDVSSITLLQRAAPEAVLARVFGVMETLILATIAIGGLVASLLVAAIGAESALLVSGAFLPVTVALTWAGLRGLDAAAGPPAPILAALRAHALFAPLPGSVQERLAFDAAEVRLDPGTVVFRQGDVGDRFYLVAEGAVDVTIDGRHVAAEGPGEGFGEIALLHDTPRTGTVTTTEPTLLYALDRDTFVTAVTGHPASAAAADKAIATRLVSARPALQVL